MRVYFFSEASSPRAATLDSVIAEFRSCAVSDERIATLIYDLNHTGFTHGSDRNGRYVILNAAQVDAMRMKPDLSLVTGGVS